MNLKWIRTRRNGGVGDSSFGFAFEIESWYWCWCTVALYLDVGGTLVSYPNFRYRLVYLRHQFVYVYVCMYTCMYLAIYLYTFQTHSNFNPTII